VPTLYKKLATLGFQGLINADKKLTLANLASEPKIVPAIEQCSIEGGVKFAIVTNGGYALTQLVNGAEHASVYSLAPEEYKENEEFKEDKWKGIYRRERRRFVLMAQELYGSGSTATDAEKQEGEDKWQQHILRLTADPIKNKRDIDAAYLINVSASNPTSLAWVIKIDLELAYVMRCDKTSDHNMTARAYVGPDEKPIWFGSNTITAIRGVMGYSVPAVLHFGNDACYRCRDDLVNATTQAQLLVKREAEPKSYKALALPCGQSTKMGRGATEGLVFGTGNCFRCVGYQGCSKNTGKHLPVSGPALEKLAKSRSTP
jgi:hypothetical protein